VRQELRQVPQLCDTQRSEELVISEKPVHG
jgi:hypothetical protein